MEVVGRIRRAVGLRLHGLPPSGVSRALPVTNSTRNLERYKRPMAEYVR